MAKIKISNDYIAQSNHITTPIYPKYTTQIINLANQNAGATRPKNVGQLSEMLPDYIASVYNPSVDGWKEFYLERQPDAIDSAVERIWAQVENLKKSMNKIDKDLVRLWTEDLVYNKTFNGLYYQGAILKKIAEVEGKDYRLATPEEEAKNIDGFVGGVAYQIKPASYDFKSHEVHEDIPCKIVKYEVKKSGIEVDY